MAKKLAILFGVIFVVVGLLGFVGNPLVGAGAFFDTDTLHNIVHILIGAILLVVAFWAANSSALWLKIIGVVYLVLAILGFLTVSGTGLLLGLVEINGADNWLHLVLGIVVLLAGIYAKDEPMASGMAMPPSNMGAM